jgi:hypothetical protein
MLRRAYPMSMMKRTPTRPRLSPIRSRRSRTRACRGRGLALAALVALGAASACRSTPSEPAPAPTPAAAKAPAAGPAPIADRPVAFGPKCLWIAVRGATPEAVARALKLEGVEPSTWATGVRVAYAGRVFVTPVLDHGWVLAASVGFPDTGDALHADETTPWLARIAPQFPELQFFATHRVIEWHAWARYVNGAPVRKFSFLGEDGTFIWDEGAPTPEERKLGLVYKRVATKDDDPLPLEQDVLALAGLWSVDPSKLGDGTRPPGLGLVGSLPKRH